MDRRAEEVAGKVTDSSMTDEGWAQKLCRVDQMPPTAQAFLVENEDLARELLSSRGSIDHLPLLMQPALRRFVPSLHYDVVAL